MRKKLDKIFETHAHYDDKQFDNDRDKLLTTLHDNGIDRIVNISYDYNSIQKTIELAKNYDFIYGAIGYHPTDVKDITDNNIEQLEELSKNERIVAIGEIGLDYYWKDVEKDVQKLRFRQQIEMALKLNLPIVVHSRDAAADTLEILSEYDGLRGVIHCFSYSVEMAREFLKLGYYLGIGGVSTFKNAKHIKEVIKDTPLDRIVLETDSPYLAPTPFRGKRNNSAYLVYVANTIGDIKGIAVSQVMEITYKNAKRMYNISC